MSTRTLAFALRIFGNVLAFSAMLVLFFMFTGSKAQHETASRMLPYLMAVALLGMGMVVTSMFMKHFERMKDAKNFAADRIAERIANERDAAVEKAARDKTVERAAGKAAQAPAQITANAAAQPAPNPAQSPAAATQPPHAASQPEPPKPAA